MKNTITIIVLMLASYVSFSQNGPKIDLQLSNNTVDYGLVKKSADNGIRNFTFINNGDAPLSILGIQSTASFTILYSPNQSIAPGKSDRIEIKYNMTTGPIRKTITLETNAVNYEGGRVPLKIKGEVTEN